VRVLRILGNGDATLGEGIQECERSVLLVDDPCHRVEGGVQLDHPVQ
jgi:hypothetical protein